ncbi:MAG: ATP synthase F1 subunit delta [Ignavibacteria bacterium]|jgi:F-type H+-transporting ATPase subunit delta|nr:ATP synthase F1 subunit delta [Ignavibacteria bacterium]
MEYINVAMRYAKAIYPVAKEGGFSEILISDLSKIISLLKSSKDLRLLVHSPVIPHNKKLRIFEEIFKEHITGITYNFLMLLVSKGREGIIAGIHRCFVMLYNAENGILVCQITTATELDASAKLKLEERIATASNMKVFAEYDIDKSIIGGMRVRIEDWVYDASIRNKLKELHRTLVEE